MTNYQCPQCLWVGTKKDMEACSGEHICPNCYIELDHTWEEV